MKKLALMTLGLISLAATAQAGSVTKYDQITKGTYQVRTPAPNCPPNAACAMVSILDITVPLNGCVDDAVISYKLSRLKTGKIKVAVSALNINNPQSAEVKCIMQATKSTSIVLGTGVLSKDNIEIEFLDTLATAN